MPPARRNHTVPQLWLNAFAVRGQLTARNRAGKEHLTGVRDATVVAHFYRDESPAAFDPQAVETFLANQVEDPATGVVQDLVGGRLPVTEDAVDALKRLIAFQLVRTPAFRSVDRQIAEHLWPIMWAFEVIDRFNQRRATPLTGAALR
ncbi:DUF4238 domain-containing protein [Actinoplanes sp. CA-131856]